VKLQEKAYNLWEQNIPALKWTGFDDVRKFVKGILDQPMKSLLLDFLQIQ